MGDAALVTNAADTKQVNYGRRKEQRRERAYKSSLQAVMGSEQGRFVLAHLLERAGIWTSTFHETALVMAFKEGRRATGLQLLEDLVRVAPMLYDRLEAERRARYEADSREAEAVQLTAKEE